MCKHIYTHTHTYKFTTTQRGVSRIRCNNRSSGLSQRSQSKHTVVANLSITVFYSGHQHRQQPIGQTTCHSSAPGHADESLQDLSKCSNREGAVCHCARGFLLRKKEKMNISLVFSDANRKRATAKDLNHCLIPPWLGLRELNYYDIHVLTTVFYY